MKEYKFYKQLFTTVLLQFRTY